MRQTSGVGRDHVKFEYRTTFFPVEYEAEERGVWVFKERKPPNNPDENSLIESPEYQRQMREMGDEGWDLAGVQSLLRGTYTLVGTAGFGYSLTAG
jgi:hypothetical protein